MPPRLRIVICISRKGLSGGILTGTTRVTLTWCHWENVACPCAYCFALFWPIRSGYLASGMATRVSCLSPQITSIQAWKHQLNAMLLTRHVDQCCCLLLERLSWILLVLRFANLQGSPRSRRSADSKSLDQSVPVRFWRLKELQVDDSHSRQKKINTGSSSFNPRPSKASKTSKMTWAAEKRIIVPLRLEEKGYGLQHASYPQWLPQFQQGTVLSHAFFEAPSTCVDASYGYSVLQKFWSRFVALPPVQHDAKAVDNVCIQTRIVPPHCAHPTISSFLQSAKQKPQLEADLNTTSKHVILQAELTPTIPHSVPWTTKISEDHGFHMVSWHLWAILDWSSRAAVVELFPPPARRAAAIQLWHGEIQG